MTVTIVGAQLGDEGKGGIVDLFSDEADVVARYQGGDNAGHTVVESDSEYKLSLVPSGAIRGRIGVLGNGCVINPRTLFEELDTLRDRGIDPDVRLAERAHVILPFHRVLDGIEEQAKSDSNLDAGTTGRGIGPTYEDKAGRRGIRVGDLLNPSSLRTKLEYVVPQKRAIAEQVFNIETDEAFDVDAIYREYHEYGERIERADMAVQSGEFLLDRIRRGDNVILEGAQGTGIDIDHGIYPFVTSSNPTAGCAATGTGLGPTVIGRGEIIGVIKAYLSRVGTGPLPTEITGKLADEIRDRGGEFGTVTGRPRRIGWLDMPMLRHATRVNGFTGLAINHLDVLAGLDEVKIAHEYALGDTVIDTMPSTTERWAECDPRFRVFDGWPDLAWDQIATEGYDALPANAQTYLDYIRAELETSVVSIGVGPNRAETIIQRNPFTA